MNDDGWRHLEAGRLNVAAAVADTALASDPDDGQALHLRGILAWLRGERAAGIEAVIRASARLGDGEAAGAALRDLCEMHRMCGQLEQALEAGRGAVRLKRRDPDTHYNLGIVLQELGDLDGAVTALRAAISLAPEHAGAHFELAETLLLGGDFVEGWEEYEWRFRVPGAPALMPPTSAPAWSGEHMSGRLLLVADQGYGDVIQFLRFVPEAASRCGELVIACSEEMEPLISRCAPEAARFRLWEQAPAFDAYAAFSSLPRLFGVRLETIPARQAYLEADPRLVAQWRRRLATLAPAGNRAVGIVWAGRPTHGNDANRSMPLAALGPLGALARTTLVALQEGEAAAQVGRYFVSAPLVNLGPEIGDFANSAAIIANLDLVVSVDTSVAHLSGALGRPTAVLLPFAPDWRWLRGRSDSPWYPSAKLYRQARRGDWTDPVRQLAADLAMMK